MKHEYIATDTEGKKYKVTAWECPYCSPDGTIGFPDGRICDECGGKHDYEEYEEIQ